ncbi:MAG TPA: HipA N-terminal domain-containing protein [Syntrophales bacterium]|nr:HipA N-terminal domain-containing protein [Syntrophales bacterium]
MRKADVYMQGKLAGVLQEIEKGKHYRFIYLDGYAGPPISLTMPVRDRAFDFDRFPPFFDGLLPEGVLLEALLKRRKIDRRDYFSQIVAVGEDLVGAVTVKEAQG